MNFSEKKIIYRLFVLIFHFLFCGSIYGTDKPGFFGDLFGSSEKPPHKTSSSPVPLPSHNPEVPRPQEIIPEQVKPLSQQAEAFLQEFPKILREMADLERHIPTLIPEHRRNPENLCNYPKNGDWRVLMAWSVRELDPSNLERSQKIDADIEAFKKKKSIEKGKDLKSKPQDTASLFDFNGVLGKEAEDERLRAMARMPEMLRLWFFNTCNPEPQSLRNFLQDYMQFSQWWDDLAPELTKSQDILVLYSLLQQGNNGTMILCLLDGLLVQSLLLKSQSLYEELLPTFLDLNTSCQTLKNLREEASREDDKLTEILENSNLYKKIESLMAKTIESAVTPLLEDCLKQTTDDQFQQSVRIAFQQAMRDALIEKSNSLQEKGPEKKRDSEVVEEDAIKILRENLQKIIVTVIREAITCGLNEATGRFKKDEPLQSSSSWRVSSKQTTEASMNKQVAHDNRSLTVDIAPIMQALSDFIKPPEQTMSRWYWAWSSNTKSPISPNLIPIPIPVEIQQQWEIPPYRPLTSSRLRSTKGALGKGSKRSARKFPKVESCLISFEESQKEYLKNPFPESNITSIRTGVLEEIESLREYRCEPTHLQPQSLEKFLGQRNSAHLLFDFPKAYAYVSGIEGAQLLPRILRFFEEYEGLITSYRKNLQETAKSDLNIYLNPKRPSLNLYKSRKVPFFNAFPLLDTTELKTDWVSLEVINLLEREFVNNEDKDGFRAKLENYVFLLSMVDGFADESLNIDHLAMTRLRDTAKKILFFKEECEALKAGKYLPSEEDNQHLISALFDKKCQTVQGVSEAISRMLERERTKKQMEDEKFTEDRILLIKFFTDLFRDTLTKCLFEFGLTAEKLETLKKISSPLPQKLGDDQKISGSPIQPTNSGGPSQLLLDSQKDSEVTLHVPVDFLRGPQIPSGNRTRSNIGADQQNEDDSGLPPVEVLNFSGESLF